MASQAVEAAVMQRKCDALGICLWLQGLQLSCSPLQGACDGWLQDSVKCLEVRQSGCDRLYDWFYEQHARMMVT